MPKSFIDVAQDAPRMGLGIPVKTKKPPLSNRPWNRITALNFAGSWFQLKVAYGSSVIHSPKTPIHGHTPVRQAG